MTQPYQGLPGGESRLGVLIRQLQGEVAQILLPDAPVTSLPATPFDGQEVSFQNAAMATNGVIWRLRYRAASASVYKWECVGGPPLVSVVNAAESLANATTSDLGTLGPDLTAPLAGEYLVAWGARIQLAAAGIAEGWMVLTIGGASTGLTASFLATAQYGGGSVIMDGVRVAVGAGALFRCRYATQGSLQFMFQTRWLRVTPVRVG